jgi:hypothetical protein
MAPRTIERLAPGAARQLLAAAIAGDFAARIIRSTGARELIGIVNEALAPCSIHPTRPFARR